MGGILGPLWCGVALENAALTCLSKQLLDELSTSKGVQRDALYYQATALYRLEQYVDARKALQQLLSLDPNNRQAADMKALVNLSLASNLVYAPAQLGP